MPKRSRSGKPNSRKPSVKLPTRKRPARLVSKAHQQEKDENQTAFSILQGIIKRGEADGKNPLAVALGRMGGLKGGKARAEKLTDKERQESARKAATARWSKKGA